MGEGGELREGGGGKALYPEMGEGGELREEGEGGPFFLKTTHQRG